MLATASGTFDAIPSTIIQPWPLTPSPTSRTPSMPTSENQDALLEGLLECLETGIAVEHENYLKLVARTANNSKAARFLITR